MFYKALSKDDGKHSKIWSAHFKIGWPQILENNIFADSLPPPPQIRAKINSRAGLGGIHLNSYTQEDLTSMAVSPPYWEENELIIDGLSGDLSAMLANKPNQWLRPNSQSLDTGHHPSPSNFRCDLFVALVIGPGASCIPCQGLHLWAGSRVLSNFKL